MLTATASSVWRANLSRPAPALACVRPGRCAARQRRCKAVDAPRSARGDRRLWSQRLAA
ncbi:MAG: hypothetical protein MZW92_76630 [Comamonadaceae bacterium]|nr:hypothetical protein [Comamonadaceae bacterium]